MVQLRRNMNLQKAGWTALHLAVWNMHAPVVKILLGVTNLNLSAGTRDGWTALHMAVWNNDSRVIKMLLEAGASPLDRDKKGWSPLHWASNYGHINAIELLKETGIDISSTGLNGLTPMHIAAANGDVDMIYALVKAGGDLTREDDDGVTAMEWGQHYGHECVIEFFEELSQPPLHRAALMGNADLIRQLKESGEDMSLQDDNGRTALHCAVLSGFVDAVNALKADIDIWIEDNKGVTAMQLALEERNYAIIEALEDARI